MTSKPLDIWKQWCLNTSNNVYDYLINTIQLKRLCPIPLYSTPSNYRTIQIHYLICNQNILLINCKSSISIQNSTSVYLNCGIFPVHIFTKICKLWLDKYCALNQLPNRNFESSYHPTHLLQNNPQLQYQFSLWP